MNCNKCIHEKICVIKAFPDMFENTQWYDEPCDHFKSKSDFEDVNHGEWKINPDGYYPYCSSCKTEPKNGVMSNYCPNCGVKMKKGNLNI